MESPFVETVVMDLDVIWFKSPDVMFDSPAYKKTGSLFFRDRVDFRGFTFPDPNRGIIIQKLDEFFEKHDIIINKTTLDTYYLKNGINLYWKYGAMDHGPKGSVY